jgi:phage-related protein
MKKVIMHPKAREMIKSFPKDVKEKLGQYLLEVQKGFKLIMPKSRPMPSIAVGAEEIRVKGKDGIYWAFYYTKDDRGVILFHAFRKKTQKTSYLEIELGKRRLRELINEKS